MTCCIEAKIRADDRKDDSFGKRDGRAEALGVFGLMPAQPAMQGVNNCNCVEASHPSQIFNDGTAQ